MLATICASCRGFYNLEKVFKLIALPRFARDARMGLHHFSHKGAPEVNLRYFWPLVLQSVV